MKNFLIYYTQLTRQEKSNLSDFIYLRIKCKIFDTRRNKVVSSTQQAQHCCRFYNTGL